MKYSVRFQREDGFRTVSFEIDLEFHEIVDAFREIHNEGSNALNSVVRSIITAAPYEPHISFVGSWKDIVSNNFNKLLLSNTKIETPDIQDWRITEGVNQYHQDVDFLFDGYMLYAYQYKWVPVTEYVTDNLVDYRRRDNADVLLNELANGNWYKANSKIFDKIQDIRDLLDGEMILNGEDFADVVDVMIKIHKNEPVYVKYRKRVQEDFDGWKEDVHIFDVICLPDFANNK